MDHLTAAERAEAVLAAVPLVDGHNDLPWALRNLAGPDPTSALASADLTAGAPDLHTDIPRLRKGQVGAQFWSVYVPSSLDTAGAVTAVFEQVELVHLMTERYPDDLGLALTADAAESAFAQGRVASLLGAEGGHCIGNSLGTLRSLRRLGVRYMTLTHNDNTDWADSATDEAVHGGLTDFGHEVVREMNRIGMLVDLSHVAPTTMRDAIATSTSPVMFTHSSCRAVTDHPRNVPDDVLESLPANGGVCMVTFVPSFVSSAVAQWELGLKDAMLAAGRDPRDHPSRPEFLANWDGPPRPTATLDDVVAHVEHAREVAGIDHIGIGGDYDGVDALPVGLEDVSRYPALFTALLERGWSEDDCAKLAGRNALRVLRASDTPT
ncbi:dipeptidase [Pseudonocardia sp. TRM90224]|uniref:dipeptidase n=1 Tax=Pseudonocardia sp. TRM90224 TaxID=2812678 RepID=UPI001E2F4B3B|nr:dipeptidase [Pseudonocardia sp. TRM90224]